MKFLKEGDVWINVEQICAIEPDVWSDFKTRVTMTNGAIVELRSTPQEVSNGVLDLVASGGCIRELKPKQEPDSE